MFSIAFWWAMIVVCVFVVAVIGVRLFVELLQLVGVLMFAGAVLIIIGAI